MDAIDFIRESNRIEGILREPTSEEIDEFFRFLHLDEVTIDDLVRFVSVYQPKAVLRQFPHVPGVRVGNHIAPNSGPEIRERLQDILDNIGAITVWQTHLEYERLHPFTDGNGRSGRMLWAWQMGERNLCLGFLHKFYYQTLAAAPSQQEPTVSR